MRINECMFAFNSKLAAPCSLLLSRFSFNLLVLIVCLDFMGSTLNGNKDIRKEMVETSVVILYHSLFSVFL